MMSSSTGGNFAVVKPLNANTDNNDNWVVIVKYSKGKITWLLFYSTSVEYAF